MLKKVTLILIGIVLIVGLFNYDKIAGKLLKRLPDKVDNYLATQFLPEKLWLHRVNSVGKQEEFSSKYAGLEFDLVFYDKEMAFENSHDADSLEKFNFEMQLKLYQSLGNANGMWLDFKNLTEKNKFDSLTVLSNLLEKYNVDKSKVWVESQNWQALRVFKEAGFRTSYYFPYYNFRKMSNNEVEEAKQKTEKIALSGNVDAISFYGGYYSFICDLQLPPRIVLLSWLNGQGWLEVCVLKKYANIRNDERVKVILVKDLGKYNR